MGDKITIAHNAKLCSRFEVCAKPSFKLLFATKNGIKPAQPKNIK